MKITINVFLIVVLIILFGSIPLSIISKIFEYLAIGIKWLASAINIFGWNGLL